LGAHRKGKKRRIRRRVKRRAKGDEEVREAGG
jgi:hypothetical protein